ncbi:2,3-bisphosphoglycerate-dependent phosphoglycerate mutase [Marinomonas aquimarina]|uniref:2,3-bisphosphoglycerate-dependent phosphoglycerate mutase n=1 Tax=Marinomonas aquimarina TaxID=295068 RepID=A0A1A8T620_9GAMM|nr:histidine phosphatase family protein [Marinomonas aquimarina]SBS27566.1 2,3-bisphosphoglycerate-dependent phosphoglycerate mutase [Marinomonas aquimarina]
MAICALIRHGAYEQLKNVPSALQPYPLTAEGEQEVRRQARLFKAWLLSSGHRVAPEIDASSLLRAWQTATIYKEELAGFFAGEPEVRSYPTLCERSVGAVANLSVDEIERILALDPRFDDAPEGWKSDSHYCLPFDGAESLLQAGERVAQHIQTWQQQQQDEERPLVKLFVGHGASIRHAAFHMNVMKFCDIKRFSMHYGHPVVLELVGNKTNQLFGDWKQRKLQDAPD